LAKTKKYKTKKPQSSPSRGKKAAATKKSNPSRNRLTKRTASSRKGLSSSSSSRQTRGKKKKTKSSGPLSSGKKKPMKKTTAAEYAVARIMGDGQYRIDSAILANLNKIDNEIVKLLDSKSFSEKSSNNIEINSKFQTRLSEMVSIIKNNGKELGPEELVPSDFIIPPADTSVQEAKELFQGEGIFPG
jgi:hypothetical protein